MNPLKHLHIGHKETKTLQPGSPVSPASPAAPAALALPCAHTFHVLAIKESPIPKKPSSPVPSGIVEKRGTDLVALPVQLPNDYLLEEYHQEDPDLYSHFEVPERLKHLGDGGSSDVTTVVPIGGHLVYALKRFRKVDNETDEEFYTRAAKEYVLSMELRGSQNLVWVEGMYRFNTKGHVQRLWGMVLECCEGGDLFLLIARPGWKAAPMAEKLCLFKQVVYGVKHMHDRGIVHRDIKPENVLLTGDGFVRLTDYGVSTYGNTVARDTTSPPAKFLSVVGLPPFKPPEVGHLHLIPAKQRTELDGFDGYQMDAWALGMLLFCLVYGGTPFQDAVPSDARYREFRDTQERFVLHQLAFVKNNDVSCAPGLLYRWAREFDSHGAAFAAWRLCDVHPNTRLTLDQLMELKWFKDIETCVPEPGEIRTAFVPGRAPASMLETLQESVLIREEAAEEGMVLEAGDDTPALAPVHPAPSMCDVPGAAALPAHSTPAATPRVRTPSNASQSPASRVPRVRSSSSSLSLSVAGLRLGRKVRHHHLDISSTGSNGASGRRGFYEL